MILPKATIQSLEKIALQDWDQEVAETLESLYHPYFRALDVAQSDISEFCKTVRGYAAAYQINSRKDVFKMIIVALALGGHFVHDIRYKPLISKSLERREVPSGRRLTLLANAVEPLLMARANKGGASALGERLESILELGICTLENNALLALVATASLDDTDGVAVPTSAFIDICLQLCDRYNLHTLEARLIYCVCATLHGVYWAEDPLMKVLRNLVFAPSSLVGLREHVSGFYKRLD